MTDEPRQRLSALQDGELAPAQVPALLDALAADTELRERWERYTLIGQAIRGEAIDPNARALADRVRNALAPSLEPIAAKADRTDLDALGASLRAEMREEIERAVPQAAATVIREEITALAKEFLE